MKKIFIKYNPYQVTTEISIDDNPLKKNSRLNFGDRRLQEWVDDLPSILFEECNTRDFDITFHGTIPDYEDIVAMAEEAKAKDINITVSHIPAKEVKDKETAIQEIFDMIQEGPFEELKKTAKIKNIVDTFITRIESAHTFETTRQQISQNEEQKKATVERIDSIEAKLKSGEEAKKFKAQIEKTNYDKEIADLANSVIAEAQKKITRHLSDAKKKMTRQEAEDVCRGFAKFADSLQAEVQVRLEDLIQNSVQKSASTLLETYKKKLAELVKEVNIDDVEIDPFKMMLGEIPTNTSSMISSSSKTERVKTGEKWVENTSKKLYKPWTWFQEKGHYVDIMEDREYIDGTGLAQKFFAPIEETLYENSAAAVDYAKEQTKIIKKDFAGKFDELDKVLKAKLDELKACATDEQAAEERLADSKKKLEWLEDIQARVNSILDI